MTEQLKPCPCGSKAELHESITMSGKGQFWVQSEAGWVGPVKSEPDDAIDFWNTRIDTRPTPSHITGGAVTVKPDPDWVLIGRKAHKYGVRFQTNQRLLKFVQEAFALTPASEPDTGNADAMTIAKYDDELRKSWNEAIEAAAIAISDYQAFTKYNKDPLTAEMCADIRALKKEASNG